MISIIVPIYNEESNIDIFLNTLLSASKVWEEKFEVIFIDDGSTDNSFNLLCDLADKYPYISIIRFSRNFGHQPAINAGLRQAKGDAVIILDADLQDPPQLIVQFLNKWRSGAEIVYGIRTKRKEHWLKQLAYRIFYFLLRKVSEIDIPKGSGDFSLMDRKIVDIMIHEMPERIRFVRGLRAFTGFKQVGIEYERDKRYSGKSKYTFPKLVKLAFDGLFDFTTYPLRIASYFGFIVSLFSFGLGVFFIFHRLLEFKVLGYSPADVPGMATIAVGLFFVGGIMLLLLGIIGEYMGRIYFEVKKRPNYIVRDFYPLKENL